MPPEADPMPDHSGVFVSEPEAYRYTVICWRDDCPGSLDTYGGPEVLELAREHVADYGCKLRVDVKSSIHVHSAALDEGEVDKSAPKSTKRASDLNRGHVQMTGDPLDPLGLFEAAGPTLGEDDPAALDEDQAP